MITLKEVAEKCGVSATTVSNVINGNNHKVSEETRKRVNEIIKEAGLALAEKLARTKKGKAILDSVTEGGETA